MQIITRDRDSWQQHQQYQQVKEFNKKNMTEENVSRDTASGSKLSRGSDFDH